MAKITYRERESANAAKILEELLKGIRRQSTRRALELAISLLKARALDAETGGN